MFHSNYQNIPDELRKLKQWGNFELKWMESRHKNTKIPINSYDGTNGKTNDSSTWSDYDTAIRGIEKIDRASGLAFYFDNGYVGLDIDNIADDLSDYRDGVPDTIVSEMLKLTKGTYMEISQSGNGIHAIFKGKIPGNRRRKGNFELYESGRFFALTGNTIGSNQIQSLTENEAKNLYEYLFGKDKVIKLNYDEPQITSMSVSEIINKMYESKNGQIIRLFMQGGWEQFYPSHSEADIAFCNYLAFWCGRDYSKMDQIFRNSSLMREKWDEKHGAVTYGQATLNKAINETQNVYKGSVETNYDYTFAFNKPLKQQKKKEFPPRSWDDMGMALRFKDQFGDRFRWSMVDKIWYSYNGSYWSEDNSGLAEKAGDAVINSLKDEKVIIPETASDNEKKKAVDAWNKFCKKERSLQAHTNMLKGARHLLPVQHSEWDKEAMLLNTPSGYVDLTNGILHDHEVLKMFTQETGVEYSENYDCPTWLAFLDQIFQSDKSLIHYVQKAVGYSLTGSTTEQVMFVLVGNGRNGKSVLMNVVVYIAGGYAKIMNASSIIRRYGAQGANSDIARLEGARVVVSSETNEGDRLDESLVKQMTGGDAIVARYQYGKEFEFKPKFKLWMATNHKPTIFGTDDGIWRRMVVIPFKYKIPDDKVDKHLEDKLKAEAIGILNWAIEGAMMWQREGLEEPLAIKQANKEYREEMDVIQSFINDRCVVEDGKLVKASELFKEYKDWAQETNNYEMNSRKFGQEIGKRFDKKRLNSGNFYSGIDVYKEYRFNMV